MIGGIVIIAAGVFFLALYVILIKGILFEQNAEKTTGKILRVEDDKNGVMYIIRHNTEDGIKDSASGPYLDKTKYKADTEVNVLQKRIKIFGKNFYSVRILENAAIPSSNYTMVMITGIIFVLLGIAKIVMSFF